MRAVVFAYHDMGIAGLEALKKAGFKITAVFSHEDDPSENCWFGSVRAWTKRNGISVFCPESINAAEWVDRIAGFAPEAIFSFYYRCMLSRGILDAAPRGAFNLHGSLLPAYRGRAPVNWVLVNGETRTGVTLHHMVEKPDAGDIIGQRAVDIDFGDTARTLYGKLCAAARELLAEVLPLIRIGRAPRIPQDLSKGSYFGGRRPEDGRIDWNRPAVQIYNLVRAVTDPYPGAFAFLPDGRKIMIWWAIPEVGDVPGLPPGEIGIAHGCVCVGTGAGRIRLADVETAGFRMKNDQMLQFFRNKEGMILT